MTSDKPVGSCSDLSVPGSGRTNRSAGVAASFCEVYPALPGSAACARRAAGEFARGVGAPQEIVEALELAVSEAATNVIVHAYSELVEPGEIELTVALASGELCVIVADRGSGLRPRPNSPGLGIGLAVIARLSDGLELVHRAEGGLELRMRFAVDQERRGKSSPRCRKHVEPGAS